MTKRITLAGLFMAVALVLSYVERLIPVNIGVPGVKLGLANIIILVALYLLGPRLALIVQAGRIFLAGFLFGGLGVLLYSLAGGMLSFGVMYLLYRTRRPVFSIVGISVAGGVAHNIGQILMAVLMLQNIALAYYLPILMISGSVTGFFVGLVSRYLVLSLKKIHFIGGSHGIRMEKL